MLLKNIISDTFTNDYDGCYRFGFNGKEKDKETYGEGNEYDYGFRIYNPRIGRFLSTDPLFKKYPELTTFQFASNTPIWGMDLDGLEVLYMTDGTRVDQVGESTEVRVVNEKMTFEQAKQLAATIKAAKDLPEVSNSLINLNTTSAGIKEADLNLKAFLLTVRQAENSNKYGIGEPLGYDIGYGNNKIDNLSKHPNKKFTAPDGSKSDAAGAYQIKYDSWKTINRVEKQNGFYPINQENGARILIKLQDKDNPRAIGCLSDIYNGNVSSAAIKLNGTWTSLPEGNEQKMTIGQFEKKFKSNVSSILTGN